MILSSPPTNQSMSTAKATIAIITKQYIDKHPGIYIGNLVYWIKKSSPKASKNDIWLVFIQLVKKGYFIDSSNCFYPTIKVDENEKALMRFVYKNRLSDLDFGILYELSRVSRPLFKLSELSRIVLSNYWHNNEKEIKIRIQELFLNELVIMGNEGLQVNWKLIREVIG